MPDQQTKEPQRVNLFLDPDVVLQAKVQALQENMNQSQNSVLSYGPDAGISFK